MKLSRDWQAGHSAEGAATIAKERVGARKIAVVNWPVDFDRKRSN
jgi:hypothetical protein